jgi:aromatic ring-cleaving dioxygenase
MANSWSPNRFHVPSFHAHVYYRIEDETERALAMHLYEDLLKLGSDFVNAGLFHEKNVGPHTRPMFTLRFTDAQFHQVVTYLQLNHHPFSVLIHPETGNDLLDHSKHALWLGDRLEVDFTRL